MSEANVEHLSERERALLEHLRQAREQGKSFSQYCREQDLSINQWYWVKRELMRKGVIAGRGKATTQKRAGFVPVRMVPSASAVACRLSHPSGWVIECGSFPQAQWLTALLSGAAA